MTSRDEGLRPWLQAGTPTWVGEVWDVVLISRSYLSLHHHSLPGLVHQELVDNEIYLLLLHLLLVAWLVLGRRVLRHSVKQAGLVDHFLLASISLS
jgi:hypothetical protein